MFFQNLFKKGQTDKRSEAIVTLKEFQEILSGVAKIP